MLKFLILYSVFSFGFSGPLPSDPGGSSGSINQPQPPSPPPQSTCYAYESLKVGSCSIITKVSDFSNSDRDAYRYPSSSDSRYQPPSRMIDLRQISGNTQLTKNFQLKEFMSLSKGRYGVFSEHVLLKLQKMREQLSSPLRITSGFRGPAYNASIPGAASGSRHMYGDGVDIAGTSLAKMKSLCEAQGAYYIKLYNDGHAHCDWRHIAGDKTFYDSSMILAKTTSQSFKARQESIDGKPKLSILSGSLSQGSHLILEALLDGKEDEEGDLYTEWKVTLPSGELIETDDLHLELTDLEKGSYSIFVRVGGYATSQVKLDVN